MTTITSVTNNHALGVIKRLKNSKNPENKRRVADWTDYLYREIANYRIYAGTNNPYADHCKAQADEIERQLEQIK